jgi:CRISPR-associated endoribonuclease Cas6
MRIHLKIESDGAIVPFNHQSKLTGVIHKWIGKENIEHGNVSLYSFSFLTNGKKSPKGDGLKFEEGTSFFISAYHKDLIKIMIKSIQQDPVMFDGLSVKEIIVQEDPSLEKIEVFYVASPVFIKRKLDNGKVKHYTYKEAETTKLLTETLHTKMAKVGMEDREAVISFDAYYPRAKTKVVHYNGIKNLANICPIIIKGRPETKAFIWNVGIGNSTGIGFGAIK